MTGLLVYAIWGVIPVLLIVGELRARKQGRKDTER